MDDIDNKLTRIEDKIDKIDSRLDVVDVRLERYNMSLDYHIARTDQIENELIPITTHVEQIRGAAKLIAFIVAAVGFAIMIVQFLKS